MNIDNDKYLNLPKNIESNYDRVKHIKNHLQKGTYVIIYCIWYILT